MQILHAVRWKTPRCARRATLPVWREPSSRGAPLRDLHRRAMRRRSDTSRRQRARWTRAKAFRVLLFAPRVRSLRAPSGRDVSSAAVRRLCDAADWLVDRHRQAIAAVAAASSSLIVVGEYPCALEQRVA